MERAANSENTVEFASTEFSSINEDGTAQFALRSGYWQNWAVGAAGAFFGVPYIGTETAHAAWLGVMKCFKNLHNPAKLFER